MPRPYSSLVHQFYKNKNWINYYRNNLIFDGLFLVNYFTVFFKQKLLNLNNFFNFNLELDFFFVKVHALNYNFKINYLFLSNFTYFYCTNFFYKFFFVSSSYFKFFLKIAVCALYFFFSEDFLHDSASYERYNYVFIYLRKSDLLNIKKTKDYVFSEKKPIFKKISKNLKFFKKHSKIGILRKRSIIFNSLINIFLVADLSVINTKFKYSLSEVKFKFFKFMLKLIFFKKKIMFYLYNDFSKISKNNSRGVRVRNTRSVLKSFFNRFKFFFFWINIKK